TSRRLDAVGALTEVHLVGVEREDLALRVALLDLHGDDGFLDLSFKADVTNLKPDRFGEQPSRQLLGNRAGPLGPRALAGNPIPDRTEDVARRCHDDMRHAEPEVAFELGVLASNDGLTQLRRNRVVGDDFAPLDGELSNNLSARSVYPADRARRVVVERRDLGHVAGIGEDDPGGNAEQGS